MEDLFEGQKRSKSRSRSPRAALPATGTGDGRDLPEVENSETPEEVHEVGEHVQVSGSSWFSSGPASNKFEMINGFVNLMSQCQCKSSINPGGDFC